MQLDPLPTELRPTRALLKYYVLSSLVAGPFFVFPLAFLYFRYRTLRYRIDEEGISMRWGALYRREVSLNYARIQDIHLSSNVVERWLGLGKIQVQTASASSKAEMTVEGLRDLDAMRDFLYSRMRGARGDDGLDPAGTGHPRTRRLPDGPGSDDLTAVLQQVAAEVRALREELASGGSRAEKGTSEEKETRGEKERGGASSSEAQGRGSGAGLG